MTYRPILMYALCVVMDSEEQEEAKCARFAGISIICESWWNLFAEEACTFESQY